LIKRGIVHGLQVYFFFEAAHSVKVGKQQLEQFSFLEANPGIIAKEQPKAMHMKIQLYFFF
jgi:hypothetical protein